MSAQTYPVVRRLRIGSAGASLVYVRYSPTLTQIFDPKYYEHLLAAAELGAEALVPLTGYYVKRREGGVGYTVIGPIKVQLPAGMRAGLYRAKVGPEPDFYAGVEMYSALLGEPSKAAPPTLGLRAVVRIREVLDAPQYIPYTSVNGRDYILVHPPGLAVGTVERGFALATRLAFVIGEGLEKDDVVEAVFLFSKHGRVVFAETGTSSQINIFLAKRADQ